MSLNLMKARMKQSGLTFREEEIRDAQFIERLENENDASYCETFFVWINGSDPKDGKRIHPRLYERKWSSAIGHIMKMKTLIDEPVKCGDTFHNTKENTWWICTETDCIDDVHYISTLTECNYCLKWQNEKLEILEYMCVNQNSTQYNSGITEGKSLTLTSSQHILTLPLVKDVTSLPYDKRFFLTYDYEKSPYVYKLTQNDMTSGKGLCYLTVSQTEKGANDNTKLGICDYKTPALKSELPFEISGSKCLKIGIPKTYTLNTEDNNVNFIWRIISDFNVLKTADGNNIELYTDNESCIGESFLLQAVSGDTVIGEIEITVTETF